jgi:hypothetical protein
MGQHMPGARPLGDNFLAIVGMKSDHRAIVARPLDQIRHPRPHRTTFDRARHPDGAAAALRRARNPAHGCVAHTCLARDLSLRRLGIGRQRCRHFGPQLRRQPLIALGLAPGGQFNVVPIGDPPHRGKAPAGGSGGLPGRPEPVIRKGLSAGGKRIRTISPAMKTGVVRRPAHMNCDYFAGPAA